MALTDYSSPYDGADVDSAIALALTAIKPVADYTALRALTPTDGDTAYVAKAGVSGFFIYDAAQVATDDGGIIIQGWARQDDGILYLDWWLEGVDTSTFDCSTARDTAFDAAIASGKKLIIGPKTYRVTTGYDSTADGNNLFLEGGSYDNGATANKVSEFLLDSTDPASYFYKRSHYGTLSVKSMRFRCAQYVLDRKFWWCESGSYQRLVFENLGFNAVELPFYFSTGFYVQDAVFRGIEFRDSGTFHSEGGVDLKATLVELTSINHDGSVPVNTAATVCDLSGFRKIFASNFLLEGALPATGWTVLRLGYTTADTWTRPQTGVFVGYWSEWTNNDPDYGVSQSGGKTIWIQPSGIFAETSVYQLLDKAEVIIDGATAAGFQDYTAAFEFEDYRNTVTLRDCAIRVSEEIFRDSHFVIENTSNTIASDASPKFSNTGPSQLYKWDGGFLDGERAILSTPGNTYVFSTDATYGRKIVVTPTASLLDFQLKVSLRGIIQVNDQIVAALVFKMPTYSTGSIRVWIRSDDASLNFKSYDTSYSGQTITLALGSPLSTAPTTTVGVRISDVSVTDFSGNLEVYSVALYAGTSIPRFEYPDYPKNIQTYNSSAPTTGTWAQGDIVWNNAPSAAGTAGWICTAAPGTWSTFATIAS